MRRICSLLFAASFLAATSAQAGLFDDEEARRRIEEMRVQLVARMDKLDAASQGQIELANQIDALRTDLAGLRGQIEVLTYELETAQKRQKDFYVDLDSRLRKLETTAEASAKAAQAPAEGAAAQPAAPVDPAAEMRDYETALSHFKAARYKDALGAFEAFIRNYPGSQNAPSAQYWVGNSHYALRDCRKAIAAQQALVDKWPEHAKASDALLNIATCQQELGDAKAAQKTLERVVEKYPASPAADTARQRLKRKK